MSGEEDNYIEIEEDEEGGDNQVWNIIEIYNILLHLLS